MLLETLDIKENDILIYSQNLYDSAENFKIIYKDDVKKEHHNISVNEVYSYVNQFTPKNLIIYRILTNVKNFDIHPPKYGFFVSIHNINELIYFDPIFAIKEIENYGKEGGLFDLRFRIQQVGLTTLNRTGNIANYAELYSVDLQAEEAKYQNDKIIADAILAHMNTGKKRIEPISAVKQDTSHKKSVKDISHEVSEDKEFDKKKIRVINHKGSAGVNNVSGLQEDLEDIIDLENLSKESVAEKVKKNESDFAKFIHKKKNTADSSASKDEKKAPESNNENVLDIFKSPESLNSFIEVRKQKPVVLKLNKK